jgi:hypothetical protein
MWRKEIKFTQIADKLSQAGFVRQCVTSVAACTVSEKGPKRTKLLTKWAGKSKNSGSPQLDKNKWRVSSRRPLLKELRNSAT